MIILNWQRKLRLLSLNNLPKIMQVFSGGAGTWIHNCVIPKRRILTSAPGSSPLFLYLYFLFLSLSLPLSLSLSPLLPLPPPSFLISLSLPSFLSLSPFSKGCPDVHSVYASLPHSTSGNDFCFHNYITTILSNNLLMTKFDLSFSLLIFPVSSSTFL